MTSEHVNSGGGVHATTHPIACPGTALCRAGADRAHLAGITCRTIEALSLKADDVLGRMRAAHRSFSVWGAWSTGTLRNKLRAVVIDGMVRDLLEIETQADAILFAGGRAPAIAGFSAPSVGAIGEPGSFVAACR